MMKPWWVHPHDTSEERPTGKDPKDILTSFQPAYWAEDVDKEIAELLSENDKLRMYIGMLRSGLKDV